MRVCLYHLVCVCVRAGGGGSVCGVIHFMYFKWLSQGGHLHAHCPFSRADRPRAENRSTSSNTKRGGIRGGKHGRTGVNTNTNTNTRTSTNTNTNPTTNDNNAGGSGNAVMTRKRRLIHEVEAHLAFGITPYWEGSVDVGGETGPEGEGTPRRSRRGLIH